MGYRMTREENIFFAKRNIVDNIYREARLEGIAVTFAQTDAIYAGRVAAGLTIDETVAINNLKHGWAFILDTLDVDIDLPYIRQLHGIVGSNIVFDAGNLREQVVPIGGTSWKPDIHDYDWAKGLAEELAALPDDEDKGLIAFMELARAQLFNDGNKRTAQLIANKIMIAGGYGTFSVPTEDDEEFKMRLVNWYETNDRDVLLPFLKSKCVDGYNSKTLEIKPTPAELAASASARAQERNAARDAIAVKPRSQKR